MNRDILGLTGMDLGGLVWIGMEWYGFALIGKDWWGLIWIGLEWYVFV